MTIETCFHEEFSDLQEMPSDVDTPDCMIMQANMAMRFNGWKRAVLSMQALD